jgi:IS5 family transposase
MDNRQGLCAHLALTDATEAEHRVADRMLRQARQRRWRIKTVGADKGYCVRAFIRRCRQRGIAPHVARIEGRRTPGLDGRTTRHAGYAVSQRKRKRVEEIFGWLKTYGGLRKTRFVGQVRVALQATLAVTAYNLLRMAKLAPGFAT